MTSSTSNQIAYSYLFNLGGNDPDWSSNSIYYRISNRLSFRLGTSCRTQYRLCVVEMGKSTQRRCWAITINSDLGDVQSTEATGRPFEYNEKNWEYFVGLPECNEGGENAHRHCGVRCLDQAVSKSAARAAFAFAVGCSEEDLATTYFKEVEKSWKSYLAYAFKGNGTSIDAAMRIAVESLLKKGRNPTKRNLTAALGKEYGWVNFTKKFKTALDVYIHAEGAIDERGIDDEEVDEMVNKDAMLESFKIFRLQIGKAISEHGIETSWADIHNLTKTEQLMLCELLSVLPVCAKRRSLIADNLPGLYLWGNPQTGKSAFFDSGVYLKKFPLDSEGVSRFRLTNMQSGYLFDDVPPNFVNKETISSTLRQMVIGGNGNIKTFGDTETANGWVVVTSNNAPCFIYGEKPQDMSQTDWDRNNGAWKRRFLCIKFTETVDVLPVNVFWGDNRLRRYCAILAWKIIQEFKKTKNEIVERYFKRYEEVLFNHYTVTVGSDLVPYNVQQIKEPVTKYIVSEGGKSRVKACVHGIPYNQCTNFACRMAQ